MSLSHKLIRESQGIHKKTYNIELSFSEGSESADAFAKAVRAIYSKRDRAKEDLLKL